MWTDGIGLRIRRLGVRVPPSAPLFSQVIALASQQPVRDLRARGADMDWDQALAYTLTKTSQALSELRSETQP